MPSTCRASPTTCWTDACLQATRRNSARVPFLQSTNLRSYEFNPDLARELMGSSTYASADLASGDFPRITLTISGSFGAAVPTVSGGNPGAVAAGTGHRG